MLIFYPPYVVFSNILDLPLLIHVFLLFPYCFNLVQPQEIERLPDVPGSWKEKELIQDLLHDYEKKARPVVDGVSPIAKLSETLSVQQISIEFGLSLIRILDMDENKQVLSTSIRTLYKWKDYHMVWDPAEYDNITSVNIPSSKLWLPDIALYNHADERFEERRKSDLLVSYTGTVEWTPLAIYKSACYVNIRYFPFDVQECKFKFGPWTYDAARTNITFYNNSDQWFIEDYEASPEWKLLTTRAEFHGIKYECCAEVYPDITFSLKIKRQPAFYNYVIILPCFLLSSLTLVLFCLPAETPAKMQLGMSMFQAFNFLLLILSKSIPTGASSFPLIGTYYCVNMFLVTLSTFLCLIVVNCHFRGDSHSELPQWAKMLFLVFGARIFFINSGTAKSTSASPSNATAVKSNNTGGGGSGGSSRRAAEVSLAEAAHTDKLMRSSAAADRSAYRSTCQSPPGAPMGRYHIRDSFRSRCSCELGCHVGGGCCQAFNENSTYYQPPSSLCPECQQQQQMQQQHMQQHHNQQMGDTCCQQCSSRHVTTHRCQPSHASMSHAAHASCSCEDCNASYREQEPPCRLPPSSYQRNAQPKSPFAEEDATSQTCPACAAVASSGDCVLSDASYNDAHCPPKDPDAALADVWASAAHHRSGRSLRGNIPSSNTPRRPPYYNTDNLLVECIGGEERNQFGYSTDCAQCRQCESERYAAGIGGANKPDARVLRRVATVTRDIGEIVRGIRYFQRKNEEKEKFQKIINEWRTVGGVLDRLFFICYLIAISITIIMYFPRPSSDE